MSQQQKPSILIIEQGQSFGGAIISLSQTIACFKKIDPLLITFMPPEASAPWVKNFSHVRLTDHFNYKARNSFTDLCKSRVPTRLLKKLFFKGYALASVIGEILLAHKIARIGRKHRVRLVHCNNGVTHLSWRVAKIMRLPLVYHFRGADSANTYTDEICHAAAKYIAITHFLAEEFSRKLSVPLEKISLIYDPVDHHIFEQIPAAAVARARQAMNAGADDVVYLIAARVIAFKGQLEFLQCALPLLRANAKFKIAILGDNADESPDYFQQIKQFILDHQLQQQVVMLGFQADPMPFIKAADVIMHFSLGPEGFGRSIIEAWAAKKPIIATAIGGPIELIDDGKDGYLVDPNNIDQCRDRINNLLSNALLRESMGNAGFARVLDSFTQEAIAAQLENALLELIP
ncbi:glycosyltransferase family 4 protein [Cellvibrio sp.]